MATTVERVTFDSHGQKLVGMLQIPRGAGPVPAVVVIGTWTSVKEQMSQNYARRLAERGFAALAFDTRGYGESAGEPRNVESPAMKAEDLCSAVGYLASRRDTDPQRVSMLGICAGAMYAAAAAAEDRRIYRLALVAPWIHDRALLDAMYGGAQGVAEKIAAGVAARTRFEQTGEVEYVKVASPTEPTAVMPLPADVIDYYLNPKRGAVPQWPNQFAVMAWVDWLHLDGVALASGVKLPTVLVHSEAAAIPDGAHRFVKRLAAPVTEHWIEGRTQFQFYDEPATINAALESVVAHLNK